MSERTKLSLWPPKSILNLRRDPENKLADQVRFISFYASSLLKNPMWSGSLDWIKKPDPGYEGTLLPKDPQAMKVRNIFELIFARYWGWKNAYILNPDYNRIYEKIPESTILRWHLAFKIEPEKEDKNRFIKLCPLIISNNSGRRGVSRVKVLAEPRAITYICINSDTKKELPLVYTGLINRNFDNQRIPTL